MRVDAAPERAWEAKGPYCVVTVLVYPLGDTFAEHKLQTLAKEEWPAIPTLNQPPIDLDDNFKAALQTASDCANDDESRRILNGVCLDVSERKAHYVVGTDGRHLFSANFLATEWQKARTQKRVGNFSVVSLDWAAAEERYDLEPADHATPDRAFDRQWAPQLLESMLRCLESATRQMDSRPPER